MMLEDIDLLQGTWIVTGLEMDGQQMPAAMLANGRIAVHGKRFVSTGIGAEYEGTLELDISQTPRHLNMMFDVGPEKGNTNFCIYEIKGDQWKLCIATHGATRPSGFVSPPGSGFAVETLRRSDAAPTSDGKSRAKSTRKATENSSPGKETATELEGEWRMIAGIMNGKAMDESMVKWVKRVTHGTETAVHAGPQVMMKAEFTSDPSQSPKTIDYLNTAGAHKGKKQQGIYELRGDELKVCIAAPGAPRPTKLESTPGDGSTLTIWERVTAP
jgi:uncharacterized protein (TIGR03067 family)